MYQPKTESLYRRAWLHRFLRYPSLQIWYHDLLCMLSCSVSCAWYRYRQGSWSSFPNITESHSLWLSQSARILVFLLPPISSTKPEFIEQPRPARGALGEPNTHAKPGLSCRLLFAHASYGRFNFLLAQYTPRPAPTIPDRKSPWTIKFVSLSFSVKTVWTPSLIDISSRCYPAYWQLRWSVWVGCLYWQGKAFSRRKYLWTPEYRYLKSHRRCYLEWKISSMVSQGTLQSGL